MIDISSFKKEDVLKALYDNAKPQGLGFMHYTPEPMTLDQAKDHLAVQDKWFDYLNGRVMKVDLTGPIFEEHLYDRDNGEGSSQRAIDSIPKP